MREEEMKKLIALVSTMAMAVSLAGCSSSGKEQSAASGVSGTFEGTAQGKGGDVKVTLTLTDSKITDVAIRSRMLRLKAKMRRQASVTPRWKRWRRRSRIPAVSE